MHGGSEASLAFAAVVGGEGGKVSCQDLAFPPALLLVLASPQVPSSFLPASAPLQLPLQPHERAVAIWRQAGQSY